MKIVIVGDGKVGFALSAQLSADGHDVTVIDNKQAVLGDSSERLDVLTIHGNGASIEIQKEAGVFESDLLIAATGSDETNLLCCMVAKKLGCKHNIARVRNPEYAGQLALMRNELGLTMAINPERAAALEIFDILRFPAFLKTDPFAKGKAHMVEVKLKENSPYIGKKIADLYDLVKIRVLICAVKRGENTFIPGGGFVLQTGDKIFATAPSHNLEKLVRFLGVENRRIDDVIIIGGSRIAAYLAANLISSGIGVKIIEHRHEVCMALVEKLPKAVVIHGDGTNQRILLSEGIEGADAVVTLTNIDEENLIISMYANYLGVPKVITKINRTEYNDVFVDKGIDCVVSPKDLTVETILHYVRSMTNAGAGAMVALHRIADGAVDAMEFVVGEGTDNLGKTLTEIRFKPNILLACISRKGNTIVPKGADTIEIGDIVFVVAHSNLKIAELNDIFAKDSHIDPAGEG